MTQNRNTDSLHHRSIAEQNYVTNKKTSIKTGAGLKDFKATNKINKFVFHSICIPGQFKLPVGVFTVTILVFELEMQTEH